MAGDSTQSSANLPATFAPAEHVKPITGSAAGSRTPSANSKEDFGLIHAPVQNFCGNAGCEHASATRPQRRPLGSDTSPLPASFARCRSERLRLAFFNVAARIVRHARQLWLRIPPLARLGRRVHRSAHRIRTLPAYA
ncbi:MAG: hypothetical protein R2697_11295 [Ilumatobacteraceae bacterium]